ncbi:DUF6798 domain-containing protein [Lignipirellula cremea]|uniref:DUF6798 domain-containing protein n=1 Tax=Lignipirellula cremea TaxID=2528010 RepID=A0A518DT06_9BACT|nr:DUF6798 domain-containing protein [Lignipirellula cremea]QDU94981.1 hypothetical protein Pla8534_27900 [Lignipirellula cremea]
MIAAAPTDAAQAPRPRTWLWSLSETVLIWLLAMLCYGWPVPGVNEAHYLAKAKHFWDPSWAAGDFFLNSSDTHLVFYWTFGWLTLFLPLTAVAWVGRLVTWALLAWAWRRLSWTVAPIPTLSVLTAAGFMALLTYCHMAGEWVLGGVEAKGFAFFFMLLAMQAVAAGRWRIVWIWVGLASAFHVLVGGWSGIAVLFAWLLAGKDRAPLLSMAPTLLIGLLFSLLGLIPAVLLTWGVDSGVVIQANQIYVFERLPHHLTVRQMEWIPWLGVDWLPLPVLRHFGLMLVWVLLAVLLRGEKSLRRLQGFVAGAAAIAIGGIAIDLATLHAPDLAARLLRLYWYRLSDAVLPMGVSLSLGVGIMRLTAWKKPVGQYAMLWAIAGCIAFAVQVRSEHANDPRPDADRQTLPVGQNMEQTLQIYEEWRRVCEWVDKHLPADAVCITPRRQQTFTWRSGRAEVVNWKNLPQDAQAIVLWKQRIENIYPARLYAPEGWKGLTRLGPDRLRKLGQRYGARYLVVDRMLNHQRPGMIRLYPPPAEPGSIYEVYQIDP